MKPDRQHARYVAIFAAVAALVLLPVLALNYLLGVRSFGGNAVALRASQWQEATRGVTYAPPLSANRPFKSARLFDRLPHIDTVVFGSSTAMGITQDMFPAGMTMYNFAQTGNLLATVIAEAEFLQRQHSPALKRLVIPIDWALGSLYLPGAPGRVELAPPAADASSREAGVPLSQQLQDALSLPRVKNLIGIVQGILRASSPTAAFTQLFLQEASEDYRCADGTPAKDYDTIFRGTCTGFRYDGSATFANLQPVPARHAEALIASAIVPSSKYAVGLIGSGGVPNPLLLERLAALAREMKRRGGELVLFMSPLLPGMERALLAAPSTATPLRRTRQILDAWARDHDLVILDAGQAERYGCVAAEFVDEHHALPQCYARVFSRFWNAPRASMKPGLWNGDEPPGTQ